MRIKTEDKYYSKLIRCRAGWRCQYVGRQINDANGKPLKCMGEYIPGSDRQALHCSHILGRTRGATRWHPLNALSLCAQHHSHMGMNPLEHAKLARRLLGKEKYETLLDLGTKTVRLKKHDKADLIANLKASWEAMEAMEAAGETELEFSDPLPDHLAA